jgi:hypothetical protein
MFKLSVSVEWQAPNNHSYIGLKLVLEFTSSVKISRLEKH